MWCTYSKRQLLTTHLDNHGCCTMYEVTKVMWCQMLSLSCPNLATAESMAHLIDGYCKLQSTGSKASLWNRKVHLLSHCLVRDYELDRKSIILCEIIGEGQFGDVHKGTYKMKVKLG
ncbi:PTK2 [Cordylochernes scorpioides]|uniref:PTK2 n=1 Tax=Cordylochernes scorpioides TaxID=51811 RepID=A0ABY6K7H1_9ARAC|nr:PTK2 [Cordylochernes scorpioides]